MNKYWSALIRVILPVVFLMPLVTTVVMAQRAAAPAAEKKAPGPIPRMPDGKPNLTGFFNAESGANWGLEFHPLVFLSAPSRGFVVDPPDKMLPYLPWARAERNERELPFRGYDDPTAHCFAAGVPRSMYTPSPYQILQPPGYVIFLNERMSWRQIPLDGRQHIPDNVRLWQGDSIGHWEGDTLVVETKNLNGKAWLSEVGEFATHAATVIERLTPVNADLINYRATVTDPIAFSRPWTIEIPLRRQQEELIEIACHEDNYDLKHLKDVKDEERAKRNGEKK